MRVTLIIRVYSLIKASGKFSEYLTKSYLLNRSQVPFYEQIIPFYFRVICRNFDCTVSRCHRCFIVNSDNHGERPPGVSKSQSEQRGRKRNGLSHLNFQAPLRGLKNPSGALRKNAHLEVTLLLPPLTFSMRRVSTKKTSAMCGVRYSSASRWHEIPDTKTRDTRVACALRQKLLHTYPTFSGKNNVLYHFSEAFLLHREQSRTSVIRQMIFPVTLSVSPGFVSAINAPDN